jgi:hypothetical protein
MALLDRPSAAKRQIRDLGTVRRGVVLARTQATSVLVCSSLIFKASLGFYMQSTTP